MYLFFVFLKEFTIKFFGSQVLSIYKTVLCHRDRRVKHDRANIYAKRTIICFTFLRHPLG